MGLSPSQSRLHTTSSEQILPHAVGSSAKSPSNLSEAPLNPSRATRTFDLGMYGEVVVRDEGTHALYIVGNYVDSDLKTGFRYRVMRGEDPAATEKLSRLIGSDDKDSIVRLEHIRGSRVQGPLCMVKLSGSEGIYTDLQLHPYGIVLLPVGIVEGDSFTMYKQGQPSGIIRVSSVDAQQPHSDRSGISSSVDKSDITIQFEKNGKILPDASIEYKQSRYALREQIAEGEFEFTPRNEDGSYGASVTLKGIVEVTTSNRDGLPLTLSFLSTDDNLMEGASTLLQGALGVHQRPDLFDFGCNGNGVRRLGFNSSPNANTAL